MGEDGRSVLPNRSTDERKNNRESIEEKTRTADIGLARKGQERKVMGRIKRETGEDDGREEGEDETI